MVLNKSKTIRLSPDKSTYLTMKLIETVVELEKELSREERGSKSIGLVPTMGALHIGHLSLVKRCLNDNDICVVSIFVNPTQFNNPDDLKKYPRTLERDCESLKEVGENIIVFIPSVKEIYPEPDTRQFDFGLLDKVMEGKYRPGHFNGVAQVVSRLFDIVKPNKAYFGEKDFQQLAIIRAMVKQLNLDVEIVPMPIVREDSGLAFSSRNERLSKDQKVLAVNISKTLFKSKDEMQQYSVSETRDNVVSTINSFTGLNVEYFEIVDGNTLQSVKDWDDSRYIVGCITVFCGDVRLIDNIKYKG